MKQSDFIITSDTFDNRSAAILDATKYVTDIYDAKHVDDFTFTDCLGKEHRIDHVLAEGDSIENTFIFALHLEKRREKRIRMTPLPGQDISRLNPWVVKEKRKWIATIYRFPLKNITDFHQYGNYFRVRMWTDEAIKNIKEHDRGFPERDEEGYFIEKKAFAQIAYSLSQKHYYLSRFSTAKVMEDIRPLDMVCIRLDFDVLTGRARILKADGSIPSDEELKATLKI